MLVACALAVAGGSNALAATPTYRVARGIDGDTIELSNGRHVRLVQIDTPEIYFGLECYGKRASVTTKRLLPKGTQVRLLLEPGGDPIDKYGRLLRYVVRASDGTNINLRLVAVGAAAPWYYDGEHGRYAAKLQTLALRAKTQRRGLWGACPRTRYDPTKSVETLR